MTDPKGTSADLIIVCPHMGDGGAQRVIAIMANALCQRGLKIALLTIFDDEDVYTLDPAIYRWNLQDYPGMKATARFVRVRFLRRGQGGKPRLSHKLIRHGFMYLFVLMAVPALRHNLKRIKAPTVLSFCGSTNIITALAAKSNGRRVVISERSDPARRSLGEPWQSMRRRFYDRADVVTANSRGALEALAAYVTKEKLRYLPNPIVLDNKPSPASTAPKRGGHSIVIVGRLHELKGHDVLIRAFATVADELSDWRMAIVGRGQHEDVLRELSRELGVEGRIDWYHESSEATRHYEEADIFALPSRFEGTPNALLEAMSHGLPCIVTDASPGPCEVVAQGESGIIVPVENVEALADAIRQLAHDASLRAKLGEQARERVSDHELNKVLPVWEEVLNLQTASA